MITMRTTRQGGGILFEVVDAAGVTRWSQFVGFGQRRNDDGCDPRMVEAAREQERTATAAASAPTDEWEIRDAGDR